jgi:protein-S-isoprenylcysteine O-methyltransferase Ste14
MPNLKDAAFRYRDKIAIALFLLILAWLMWHGPTLGFGEPAEDWLDVLGLLIAVSGHALRVSALRHIGPHSRTTWYFGAQRLVKDGPYAVVRNPLYVGDWLIALGICVIAQLRWLILAGPLLAFLLYYLVALAEEQYLVEQFGAEYLRYCEATPRFFPRSLFGKRSRPTPLEGTGAHSVLRTKEYQSFLSTGACVLLIELTKYLHACAFR